MPVIVVLPFLIVKVSVSYAPESLVAGSLLVAYDSLRKPKISLKNSFAELVREIFRFL